MKKELELNYANYARFIEIDERLQSLNRRIIISAIRDDSPTLEQASREQHENEAVIRSFGLDANKGYLNYLKKELRHAKRSQKLGLAGPLDVALVQERLYYQKKRVKDLTYAITSPYVSDGANIGSS